MPAGVRCGCEEGGSAALDLRLQLAGQSGCFGDQVAFRARWPVKNKAKPAPDAVLRKVRLDRQGHGASVPELGGHASGFRLEFLPPFAYRPVMANTSASSMDQLVASGVDPKTADAIKKFVETAIENSVETAVKSSVETAVRPLGIADQSRQQETARLPASRVHPILWADGSRDKSSNQETQRCDCFGCSI